MASTADIDDLIMSGSTESSVNVDGISAANDTVPEADGIDYQRIWNGTISCLILLINGFTFVIIVRSRTLKIKTKMLIACLCGSDVLMGAMALLPRVLPQQPDTDDALCFVRFSSISLSLYATAFITLLIALDRVLALTSPQAYRMKFTATKMAFVIVGIWVLAAAMVTASLADGFPSGVVCDFPFDVIRKQGVGILGVTLLLCVLSTVCLYTYLAWQMKKRMTQVTGGRGHAGGSLRSEKRVAVTGLLLAVIFLFGYLPCSTYFVWVAYSGVVEYEAESRSQRLYIITIFPLFCCVLDPIVYFWRIKEWHQSVLRKCPGCGTTDSNSVSGREEY